MYCSNCGAEIPDGSAFCNSCGKPVGNRAQSVPEHNVIISCISAHKKAYTEVQAGGNTVKVFSGESAAISLPAGNNRIHFFTRRYGLTWVKTKDRYERDLYVEPGRMYRIEVSIGQAANRIEITG